jgi:hypothetical protein
VAKAIRVGEHLAQRFEIGAPLEPQKLRSFPSISIGDRIGFEDATSKRNRSHLRDGPIQQLTLGTLRTASLTVPQPINVSSAGKRFIGGGADGQQGETQKRQPNDLFGHH